MKLLIIGGTQFLGRHFVESALRRGYEITLFHRGKTNPDLYPDCEHIHGDRDGEIAKLGDRSWDIVIDPSGYVPRVVRQSVEYLKNHAKYYIFVSSISVYPGIEESADESAELATLDEPESEDIPKYYGALKAECERVVIESFPRNSLIVRAGMIVGPYDKMDRFNHWLRRMHEGGEVLAPGEKNAPLQIVDARDIAEWALDCAERGISGIYNTTGPEVPLTMQELLEAVKSRINPSARLTWVDNELLTANEIALVDGISYWVTPDFYGFFLRNIDKALATGLSFRPLTETIDDTWAELSTRTPGQPREAMVQLPSKLTREREAELLEKFGAIKTEAVKAENL